MTGRAWKFGDDVNTDVLAPGTYIKLPPEELALHCLETVAPGFATSVQPGDFVVGGKNFGTGSSREQAAQSLKVLGVAGVIAPSFGGIFYRNAFNLGLPAIIVLNLSMVNDGDELRVDMISGEVFNMTSNEKIIGEPVPKNLLEIVAAGGLVPYLDNRLNGKD